MRKLIDSKNVFQENAWDCVEFTPEDLKKAIEKIEKDKMHIKDQNVILDSKMWEIFYNSHKDHFFRDRKWISKEIPLNSFKNILELGCGVGNSLMSCNFKNNVIGYDFSPTAISICQKRYPNGNFYVRDITIPNNFTNLNIDCVLLIFCLSAISPEHHLSIFKSIYKILNENGKVFFRDYGYLDMVQLRYKPEQIVSENFYRRPDGTYTYFFTCHYLENIIKKAGFNIIELREDKRLLVNRKRKLTMHRIQICGIFEKSKNI